MQRLVGAGAGSPALARDQGIDVHFTAWWGLPSYVLGISAATWSVATRGRRQAWPCAAIVVCRLGLRLNLYGVSVHA